jgi:hypothetical protein
MKCLGPHIGTTAAVRSAMKLLSTALFTVFVAGCVGSHEAATTEDQDVEDAAALVTRTSTFTLQAKSFIAPIADNMVGSFGSLVDDDLFALAGATNLAFSENPPDGAQSSGQFRVWANVKVEVTCSGNSVTSTRIVDHRTDVGFEGPLKGELDAIQSRSSLVGSGEVGRNLALFSFQASGRPHILAEPAFLLIKNRTNRTIWYRVSGQVSCNASAEAFLQINTVNNTNFPSLRVWASRASGGVTLPESLIYQEAQGLFTELWFLANLPRF